MPYPNAARLVLRVISILLLYFTPPLWKPTPGIVTPSVEVNIISHE
jgi:hypothetical protein